MDLRKMATASELLGQIKADRDIQIDLYNDQLSKITIVVTIAFAVIVLVGSVLAKTDTSALARLVPIRDALAAFSEKYRDATFAGVLSDADLVPDGEKEIKEFLDSAHYEIFEPVMEEYSRQKVLVFIEDTVTKLKGYNVARLQLTRSKLHEWDRQYGRRQCKELSTIPERDGSLLGAVQRELNLHPKLISKNLECSESGLINYYFTAVLREAEVIANLEVVYLVRDTPPMLEKAPFIKQLTVGDLKLWNQFRADWPKLWSKFSGEDVMEFRAKGTLANAQQEARKHVADEIAKAEGSKEFATVFGMQIPIPREDLTRYYPFILVFLLCIIRVMIVVKRWSQLRVCDIEYGLKKILGDHYEYVTFQPPLSSLVELRYFFTGRWERLYRSNPHFLTEFGITLGIIAALISMSNYWLLTIERAGADVLWTFSALLFAEVVGAIALIVTLERTIPIRFATVLPKDYTPPSSKFEAIQ